MSGGVVEVCGGWDDVAMLEEGRRQLAPLYYPDTLVNPDTCLGIVIVKKAWFLAFEEMCAFFTWKTQMNGNSFDTKSRHA